MKRILFLHHVSTIGGGSYCLLNILKSIDRSCFEPVVCLASDGPLRIEVEKLAIKVLFFYEMEAVPYNKSIWSIRSLSIYYRVRRSVKIFKRLLTDNNVDVVYLNNMMIYPYLKPAKECGCKTVIHCREHWPLDEHTIQLQWARDAVYQFADELVAINQYSGSIFPKKKATIVYDWIDMASRYEYQPMKDIFGEDVSNLKVFLFTGGFQRIKGAYQVLKAFHEYVKDQNARLLVLGYDMRKPLVGRKALLKRVLYSFGFDINEIRCRTLVECDSRIVCLPSTYMITHIIQQSYCMLSYFTIPHANLALVESITLGIPVIAARTEESDEYTRGGELAMLFEFNNFKSFISKIESIDNRHEHIKTMLSRHAVEIINKFSKEHNVKCLHNVLLAVSQ